MTDLDALHVGDRVERSRLALEGNSEVAGARFGGSGAHSDQPCNDPSSSQTREAIHRMAPWDVGRRPA